MDELNQDKAEKEADVENMKQELTAKKDEVVQLERKIDEIGEALKVKGVELEGIGEKVLTLEDQVDQIPSLQAKILKLQEDLNASKTDSDEISSLKTTIERLEKDVTRHKEFRSKAEKACNQAKNELKDLTISLSATEKSLSATKNHNLNPRIRKTIPHLRPRKPQRPTKTQRSRNQLKIHRNLLPNPNSPQTRGPNQSLLL